MKDYDPYIKREQRVSRASIRPLNVYRIHNYRTVSGDFKRLEGDESSYVFVIGIQEGKLHAIKLNEIEPREFFSWLRSLVRIPGGTEITEINRLDEIMINEPTNDGRRIFERFVKPSQIVYKNTKKTYRTYNLAGIKFVSEVQLKPNILNLYYG